MNQPQKDPLQIERERRHNDAKVYDKHLNALVEQIEIMSAKQRRYKFMIDEITPTIETLNEGGRGIGKGDLAYELGLLYKIKTELK